MELRHVRPLLQQLHGLAGLLIDVGPHGSRLHVELLLNELLRLVHVAHDGGQRRIDRLDLWRWQGLPARVLHVIVVEDLRAGRIGPWAFPVTIFNPGNRLHRGDPLLPHRLSQHEGLAGLVQIEQLLRVFRVMDHAEHMAGRTDPHHQTIHGNDGDVGHHKIPLFQHFHPAGLGPDAALAVTLAHTDRQHAGGQVEGCRAVGQQIQVGFGAHNLKMLSQAHGFVGLIDPVRVPAVKVRHGVFTVLLCHRVTIDPAQHQRPRRV